MNQRTNPPNWEPGSDKKKPAKSETLRMRAEIGRQIRAMYDEVVSQGVPNRFNELLNRIDGHANRGGV